MQCFCFDTVHHVLFDCFTKAQTQNLLVICLKITMYNSFYFSKAAAIIASTSGSLSAISSLMIIIIIRRSGIKSTYHRIMLLMSAADILTSISIALTTLPMPKDVIYPFQTPSYGSIATCEAQGFIYMFGNGLMFMVNGHLHLYYLLRLKFEIKEQTICKYVEPVMHILCFSIAIALTIGSLNSDFINPSPTDPMCVWHTYPAQCTIEEDPTCRGSDKGGEALKSFEFVYKFTLGLASSFLTLVMSLIVGKFYGVRRRIQMLDDESIDITADKHDLIQFASNQSKTITKQAIMYCLAFVLTWVFSAVEFFQDRDEDDPYERIIAIAVLRLIFQPLQGFFNLLIFVVHKITNLRENDTNMTKKEAFKIVFFSPYKLSKEKIVNNINFIVNNEKTRRERRRSGLPRIELPPRPPASEIETSEHESPTNSVDLDMFSSGPSENMLSDHYGVSSIDDSHLSASVNDYAIAVLSHGPSIHLGSNHYGVSDTDSCISESVSHIKREINSEHQLGDDLSQSVNDYPSPTRRASFRLSSKSKNNLSIQEEFVEDSIATDEKSKKRNVASLFSSYDI